MDSDVILFPCSPEELKNVLELFGYRVHQGDMLNWAMIKDKETQVRDIGNEASSVS